MVFDIHFIDMKLSSNMLWQPEHIQTEQVKLKINWLLMTPDPTKKDDEIRLHTIF